MDREKREAEAKEQAQAEKEQNNNGGLLANAKISSEAMKKLQETAE